MFPYPNTSMTSVRTTVFQDDVYKCPECGGELLFDMEVGEVVCRDCGLVVDDCILDLRPEWRDFTYEERKTRRRVGSPLHYSIHDKGLSTTIGLDSCDSAGRKLSPKVKFQVWRLRRRQMRARVNSSTDRNLSRALSDLERLSNMLSVPYIVNEQAAVIYRKALSRGLIRGRTITAMIAASLYAAIRILNLPRTLEEVSEVSCVREKDVARCYRLILRKLNIRTPLPKPITYLSKIAEKAQVSNGVVTRAVEILHEAEEKRLSAGQDPGGLAAAALYLASKMVGEKISQSELAMAAGVTEVTLRSRRNHLHRALGVSLPRLRARKRGVR